MHTTTLKTSQELREALMATDGSDGNFAELLFRDKTLIGARIGKVQFGVSSYNFIATVESPYTKAKRYRVEVTHPNFEPVLRFFENDWEANEFMRTYEAMADTEVTKTETEVFLDDSGNVINVHVTGIPVGSSTLNDLPF